METHIKAIIAHILTQMGVTDAVEVGLSVPQLQFGDYSTNIAMLLAKQLKKNPFEIAEQICAQIKTDLYIEKAVAVRPGFVNVWVKKNVYADEVAKISQGTIVVPPFYFGPAKKVMVEFAHPNTHKLFHIGHLRNIATGESIVRMLEAVGNAVIRTNYQGDVGMHIAKCLWGVRQMQKDNQNIFQDLDLQEKIKLIGKAYSDGQTAYETSETAKAEIITINKQIYVKDPAIYDLWSETRAWSISYFEQIYSRLYSRFDRCYFESEVHEEGLKTAKQLLKQGVLVESEGAVVFNGKQYGIDTRVFINSLGFPTYEGKELGLAVKEFNDFGTLDKCIHVVTPEQTSFFKITFKVEELMDPTLFAGKQHHLAYEWVKLKEGKMSSRTGNVVEATWLIDEIKSKIQSKFQSDDTTREALAVASAKYSFLKNATSSVIAFDIDESISLEGNSAPYVMYTFVRTQSILEKEDVPTGTFPETLQEDESTIMRMIAQYPMQVHKAASSLSPHIIATYLYELAREYNSFYQKNTILKAEGPSKVLRITITKAVGAIIDHGLALMGIKTVKKM
jgi:arginyl-tRNA synthetase